ncbi:MAG: hypothetical protein KGI38_02435 [Thaumarchaeota archaeon]|nr:hypothetical protein [Nitrososphaerota archaeon]
MTDEAKIQVRTEVILQNSGNANASVTDIKMRVRYAKDVINHPTIGRALGARAFSVRPFNFAQTIPIEVGPYGSKKVMFLFVFEGLRPWFLDRANVTIDILNPKKWERKDLPILYQITIDSSGGTANFMNACFRDDQPESKEIAGSMGPWEEAKWDWDSVPQSDKS